MGETGIFHCTGLVDVGFDGVQRARRLVLGSVLRGDSVNECHGSTTDFVAGLARAVAPDVLVLGGFGVALGKF